MTQGMRHSTSRRGGKAVPRFARAVWGGIGAGVLAAFLASPAPAAGLSPDWDRDTRNGGAVPAWIVAVAELKLPPLEPGNPQRRTIWGKGPRICPGRQSIQFVLPVCDQNGAGR